jgi:hypothetical protein
MADQDATTYPFPKLNYATGSAPATPSSGNVVTYAKADGLMYSKDDAGVETLMSGGPGGAGASFYSVAATSSSEVTDGASLYDLPSLSIASVPAGTYLALVSFVGNNKSGEVRVSITDGSTTYWPSSTTKVSRHNTDNTIEFSDSGVIVTTSTQTIKAQAAASSAIGNWTIYARHLTLVKIA